MCREWFTLTSFSGYQESNAEVHFGDQAISSSELASVGWVSTWMGDHLVVPQAKLLFFSIAMLISHDNATTFHFPKQIHFKGVFNSRLISKIMTV